MHFKIVDTHCCNKKKVLWLCANADLLKLLMEKSKGGKNKHNFKDFAHICIKIGKGLSFLLHMMFKSPFNGASRFSIT